MNEKFLLKGGTLVSLEPLKLEKRDLLIEDGRVASRERKIGRSRDVEVIDCRGRLIMPGLVNANTHLYASQTLGMPAPEAPPASYREHLEDHWWRLDHALTPETIVTAAFAGALDAVSLGTTTVIDHHSSPDHVEGSLDLLRDTVLTVGLRAVLGYEVSDRDGPDVRDRALEENRRFAVQNRSDKIAGITAAHASFTLGNDTLASLASQARESESGIHVSVDEDASDGRHARETYGLSPVGRLKEMGLLGPRSVLTHAVHTSEDDRALVRESGSWVVHCPTENARRGVGSAAFETFGPLVALGTAGAPSDLLGEARAAYLQARARGAAVTPRDVIKLIVGSQQLASELLRIELGSLRRDAGADFLILNYHPRTPMTSDNLDAHILFGLRPANIEAVMIDGGFAYRSGSFPDIDTRRLTPLMRRGAQELWSALSPAGVAAEAEEDPEG